MLSELKSEQCGSLDRINACWTYCISPYVLIVLSTGNYLGQQMVTVLCLFFVLFVFSALPGFLSPYNNGSHHYVKSFGLEIDPKTPNIYILYSYIDTKKKISLPHFMTITSYALLFHGSYFVFCPHMYSFIYLSDLGFSPFLRIIALSDLQYFLR